MFLSVQKLVPAGCDISLVCGLDEVGRGPWAGPVVGCAVIFKGTPRLPGLKDSKQLTKEQREEFYEKIAEQAYFGIGACSSAEIDEMGLIRATNTAFQRALQQLPVRPAYLLIDGRDKFQFEFPYRSVIKGDERIRLVAAASIMAKVYRDRLMEDFAKMYPEFGFEDHKGYGTQRHQQAIQEHGICAIHRRSFAPVKAYFSSTPQSY